jgi:Protein of unknown function (DUF4239)
LLSLTQNVLIVLGTMAASLLFMVVLNRTWPVASRHAQNDLIGWQLSVLGTTYAVTLGFMLYTAWTNFTAASLNVEMEANALRNIYRLAEGIPQERAQIQDLTRAYAEAVIDHDWPDMAQGRLPEDSHEVTRTCGRRSWRSKWRLLPKAPPKITRCRSSAR